MLMSIERNATQVQSQMALCSVYSGRYRGHHHRCHYLADPRHGLADARQTGVNAGNIFGEFQVAR